MRSRAGLTLGEFDLSSDSPESSDSSVVHSPSSRSCSAAVHRSVSPLRRNNSSRGDVRLDIPSRMEPNTARSDYSVERQSINTEHPSGRASALWPGRTKHLFRWSASSNKKHEPEQMLERIPSGDIILDEALNDAQCSPQALQTSFCKQAMARRPESRLAHAVIVAIVVLFLVFAALPESAVSTTQTHASSLKDRDTSATWQSTSSSTPPFRMLTVCTGNTCRSPMMMILLKRELQRLGLKHVTIDSAGTGVRAAEHRPASTHALSLFSELKDHRSSRISEHRMSVYDRIFCMTNAHKEAVLEQCMSESQDTRGQQQPGQRGGLDTSSRDATGDKNNDPADSMGTNSTGATVLTVPVLDAVAPPTVPAAEDQQVGVVQASDKMKTGTVLGVDSVDVGLEARDSCGEIVQVYPGGLADPYNKTLVCSVVCLLQRWSCVCVCVCVRACVRAASPQHPDALVAASSHEPVSKLKTVNPKPCAG
jgi:protein-tyrosine-phosphatase